MQAIIHFIQLFITEQKINRKLRFNSISGQPDVKRQRRNHVSAKIK